MKPKVYIRADGNSTMGLGHLVRCMALASMLGQDFEVTFCCIDIPESIGKEIEKENWGLINIAKNLNLISIITKASIVVLDGYNFDMHYQKQIKSKEAFLVCIDDMHTQEFCADLIINHAPDVATNAYSTVPSTLFALGPAYTLLRALFLEKAKKDRIVEKRESILICFGGSDYKNLTESTLRVAISYHQFKKIFVITGASYNYLESLKIYFENNKRIVHHHGVNEQEMLGLFLKAEVAIVPASGILLEAIAAGCEVISGKYTDNQTDLYFGYRQAKHFIDAVDFSESALKSAIEKVFKSSKNPEKLIDGQSGKRLNQLFNQLFLQNKLILRKATENDLQTTYEWASNPDMRLYSFQQHKITKEEHTMWFLNKLRDEKCIYLIAVIDNNAIGSIRFDVKEEEMILSYLIDPKYQGEGFGQTLLVNGIRYITSSMDSGIQHVSKITGHVMKNNIPSVKIFERMGFRKKDDEDKITFEMNIL